MVLEFGFRILSRFLSFIRFSGIQRLLVMNCH